MKALISFVFQRFGASSRKAVLFLFPLLLLLAGGVAAVRVQGLPERFDPNLNNNAGAVPGTANGVPIKTAQSGGMPNTVSTTTGNPIELWVSRYDGPAASVDSAVGVAVSPDGSRVFVTGAITVAGGDSDWATVAYDATTGKQLWVTRFNGPGNGNDSPQAAPIVSPDGSRIYVTGVMSLGDGTRLAMRTAAYDAADGSEVWATAYQGPANLSDSPHAMALMSDGSRLFVTGWSRYPSPVFYNYATIAYDTADGSQVWVTEYHGGDSDEPYAVVVSPDRLRVFVTGGSIRASSHVDFGTVAYDTANGSQLWVARYNGPGNYVDEGRAIGVGADGSRVFVTGRSASGTPDPFDYATVAYDASNGSQLWVSRYDGPAHDDDWARELAVVGNRVIVTGGSPGMFHRKDFATVAYDTSDGHQLWVARYQGLDPQSFYDTMAEAIAVSTDGTRVFVAGGSPALGSDLDYVTAAYRISNGEELWVARYDSPFHSIDGAWGLATDRSRVYVTGNSSGGVLNSDYLTVAYDEEGPAPSPAPSPTPTATATATPSGTPCTNIVFSENFDGVVAPALPLGWVRCPPSGNGIQWVTSTILPDTAPNCAFIDDQDGISDKCLIAGQNPPFIVITSATAQLRFRNNFNTEFSPPPNEVFYDGGVLEISINGGAFTDVTDPAIGASFVTGGYTGIIDDLGGNPLAGRPAWSGNSGGYINTVVNLGPNVNGQTIRIRFRMGTDKIVGAPGWRVDTLSIVDGSCATPTPTPTPSATPTIAPSATPTTTPSATPTIAPSATPSPSPTTQAINLSTRMRVQAGDNVGIGGFIITGSAPKHVLLRAIGPSLTGVPNILADPVLELHGPGGFFTITNNNWRDDPVQAALILATGLAPANNLESAIDANLNPGAYTAVVRGNNNTTGVALIEVYDLSEAVPAKLANISTRAFVSIGDDIVIAGFILGGNSGNDRIVVRGIGPSLTAVGVPNALANPMLELRNSDGALILANNDWQDDPVQASELTAAGLAPTNNFESALSATLPPGLYTALLTGLNNGTGIGLVEVYDRGAP